MATLVTVGKRRQKRARMVLPIRVTLNKGDRTFTYLAHTLDISYGGVRVAGLRAEVANGETLLLQHRNRKAKYVVRWVRDMGAGEVHFGAECLDPNVDLWQLELPEETYDGYRPAQPHV